MDIWCCFWPGEAWWAITIIEKTLNHFLLARLDSANLPEQDAKSLPVYFVYTVEYKRVSAMPKA